MIWTHQIGPIIRIYEDIICFHSPPFVLVVIIIPPFHRPHGTGGLNLDVPRPRFDKNSAASLTYSVYEEKEGWHNSNKSFTVHTDSKSVSNMNSREDD